MKNFYRFLKKSLRSKFEIEVDVFVSKKTKTVHMSLMKPLFSYEYFREIINFIKKFWNHKQKSYPSYFFVYPKLNQNIKWHFDYIIVNNNKYRLKKRKVGTIC